MLPLVEATSDSASIVYNLYTIRKEGRDYKGGTEGDRGGSIVVSLVVQFKLRIYLARF